MQNKNRKAMFARLRSNLRINVQKQTESPTSTTIVKNRMYLEGGFNGIPYVKGGFERETTEQKQTRLKAVVRTFRVE